MQFRRSKSFGGIRLTASKKGLGVSVGKGPFRIGVGADGKVRRTVRVPGTGIYDTKVVGGATRPKRPESAPAAAEVIPTSDEEPEIREMAFEDDGSPRATVWQRNYVRVMLQGKVASMPDLSELTIGQAEQILRAANLDPEGLYRAGRTWGSGKAQAEWRKGTRSKTN